MRGGRSLTLLELLTSLVHWTVYLRNQTQIDVWASAYSKTEGSYVFGALVVASEAEQASLDVIARAS